MRKLWSVVRLTFPTTSSPKIQPQVGRRVRHKFANRRGGYWYKGTVISQRGCLGQGKQIYKYIFYDEIVKIVD